MEKTEQNEVNLFPLWNPQRMTQRRFNFSDYKTRHNAIRHSSSAFIKRKDVREIVFKKDNFKCVLCNNTSNLTIDHIISVYRCSIGCYPIEQLNIRENLQTLCGHCNSKKNP